MSQINLTEECRTSAAGGHATACQSAFPFPWLPLAWHDAWTDVELQLMRYGSMSDDP
jgi:hypothetical protein